MPWFPESLLLARDGPVLRAALRCSGLYCEWADRYVYRQRWLGTLTADHVAAEYGFDRLEEASHWLPELHPDLVAAAILDQVYRTADAPVRDRGITSS